VLPAEIASTDISVNGEDFRRVLPTALQRCGYASFRIRRLAAVEVARSQSQVADQERREMTANLEISL